MIAQICSQRNGRSEIDVGENEICGCETPTDPPHRPSIRGHVSHDTQGHLSLYTDYNYETH